MLYKDKADALYMNIASLHFKIIEIAKKKAASIRDKDVKNSIEGYLSALTGKHFLSF